MQLPRIGHAPVPFPCSLPYTAVGRFPGNRSLDAHAAADRVASQRPVDNLDVMDTEFANDGYAIRTDIESRDIQPVIPGRSNRWIKVEYERALYKQRNHIAVIVSHDLFDTSHCNTKFFVKA